MLVLNGIPANEEDERLFYSYLAKGLIEVKYMKVGEYFTNIITD